MLDGFGDSGKGLGHTRGSFLPGHSFPVAFRVAHRRQAATFAWFSCAPGQAGLVVDLTNFDITVGQDRQGHDLPGTQQLSLGSGLLRTHQGEKLGGVARTIRLDFLIAADFVDPFEVRCSAAPTANRTGPTAYAVACSPQAWSAAIPGLLAATLGLDLAHQDDAIRFRDSWLPDLLDELTIRNLRLGDPWQPPFSSGSTRCRCAAGSSRRFREGHSVEVGVSHKVRMQFADIRLPQGTADNYRELPEVVSRLAV